VLLGTFCFDPFPPLEEKKKKKNLHGNSIIYCPTRKWRVDSPLSTPNTTWKNYICHPIDHKSFPCKWGYLWESLWTHHMMTSWHTLILRWSICKFFPTTQLCWHLSFFTKFVIRELINLHSQFNMLLRSKVLESLHGNGKRVFYR